MRGQDGIWPIFEDADKENAVSVGWQGSGGLRGTKWAKRRGEDQEWGLEPASFISHERIPKPRNRAKHHPSSIISLHYRPIYSQQQPATRRAAQRRLLRLRLYQQSPSNTNSWGWGGAWKCIFSLIHAKAGIEVWPYGPIWVHHRLAKDSLPEEEKIQYGLHSSRLRRFPWRQDSPPS